MTSKFTNCIYMLSHNSAYLIDNIQCYKIGSSKALPQRMLSYKTYYPIDKIVIGYFYVKDYDCYKLDNDIKIHFDDNRIKLNGGIEFYKNITIDDIKKYFTLKLINFDFYDDGDYLELNNLNDDILNKNYLLEQQLDIQKLIKIKNTDKFYSDIKLHDWQKDLKNNYDKFMLNNINKSSLVIAPTGCGKSFMIGYLSIHYILTYSNDVIIMNRCKEIFDDDFINKLQSWIDKYNLPIDIINLINNKHFDYQIFNNQSNRNIIYIINNDKFTSPYATKFNDYLNYSFGKIKFMILDECHWSGADKFNHFLLHIKDNLVDKLIGFSATPVRMADENKKRSLKIFANSIDNSSYNILYVRDFIESIEQNERLPIKWIPIPIQIKHTNDVIELSDSDTSTDEKIKINSLNNDGMIKCIKWLNDFIVKSHWRKGIIWFDTKKSLIAFYHLITNKTYDNYSNLLNLKYFPTFSGSCDDDILTCVKNNIKLFKLEQKDAILLAIMRGTEGFDDKLIDFGFNFFLTNSSNPLLDQQKEGRTSRVHLNKITGYYGFLVSIDNTHENITNIIVKRLGNWIKYIEEFTENTKKINNNGADKKITTNSLNYLNQIIDYDLIKFIDFKDIKDKIIAYSDGINSTSTIHQIKKYMHKINKIRQMNDLELIDTELKYKKYAHELNLPINLDMSEYSYNWIKFLRHDYNQIIEQYITENECINLLKKQKFNDVSEIKIFLASYDGKKEKVPSYEYLSNGIYDKVFNFIDLLDINLEYC